MGSKLIFKKRKKSVEKLNFKTIKQGTKIAKSIKTLREEHPYPRRNHNKFYKTFSSVLKSKQKKDLKKLHFKTMNLTLKITKNLQSVHRRFRDL